MIDELEKWDKKIVMPFETVTLLFDAKVDCIKGDGNIEAIHNLVINFLNLTGRRISSSTSFYDYFVIINIMRIADENTKKLEDNRFIQIPLDFTEYVNSICKFEICTCGYKPKITFLNFVNCLTGSVICEKCGLSISKMFVYDKLFLKQCKSGKKFLFFNGFGVLVQ